MPPTGSFIGAVLITVLIVSSCCCSVQCMSAWWPFSAAKQPTAAKESPEKVPLLADVETSAQPDMKTTPSGGAAPATAAATASDDRELHTWTDLSSPSSNPKPTIVSGGPAMDSKLSTTTTAIIPLPKETVCIDLAAIHAKYLECVAVRDQFVRMLRTPKRPTSAPPSGVVVHMVHKNGAPSDETEEAVVSRRYRELTSELQQYRPWLMLWLNHHILGLQPGDKVWLIDRPTEHGQNGVNLVRSTVQSLDRYMDGRTSVLSDAYVRIASDVRISSGAVGYRVTLSFGTELFSLQSSKTRFLPSPVGDALEQAMYRVLFLDETFAFI